MAAFGDLVGRVALAQEANVAAAADDASAALVLFDRTVLDNLGYCRQRGFPIPPYLTAEVAATAAARVDLVFVLDQVASVDAIEARNKATGRKTDPRASVAMSAALEEVYTALGCATRRLAAGTVEQRAASVLAVCDAPVELA